MNHRKVDNGLKIPALTKADFERVRRVTPKEHDLFHKAVKKFRSRGRPRKTAGKYCPVTIRLHPSVLEWAKTKAKSQGIGYQTVINQTLLDHAA